MNWTWINKKTTVCPTRQGSGRLREHPTGVGPRFRWDTCLTEDGGFPEKTQRLTMPRAVGPRTDCVTCRPRTGGSAHTSPATSACGLLRRPHGGWGHPGHSEGKDRPQHEAAGASSGRSGRAGQRLRRIARVRQGGPGTGWSYGGLFSRRLVFHWPAFGDPIHLEMTPAKIILLLR